MQQLSDAGLKIVNDMAQRHGFSNDAVTEMLRAISAGFGTQAQFNHFEFGGMGQWSSGGMVMIGDMFNNNLKGRVSSLCQDLSGLIQNQTVYSRPAQSQTQSQGGGWQNQGGGQFQGSGQSQSGGGQQQSSGGYGSGASLFIPGTGSSDWWPSELGYAGSLGSQNNLRYAYFPNARRLAINNNGSVTVYDTGNNQIGGFSQQQGGDQSLTFNSQFGLVRVADLPIVSPTQTHGNAVPATPAPTAPTTTNDNQSHWQPAPPVTPAPLNDSTTAPSMASTNSQSGGATQVSTDEIFKLIEKLADLHGKGILTVQEYETKKTDLLNRL